MTIQGTTAAPRVRTETSSIALYLLPLAIIVLALVPRLFDLGVFVTVDEANFWFERSTKFLHAIRSGDFAATAITDHPGVVTMWLGATGLLLREALENAGMLANATPQMYVALYQLPVAIVNALGVGAGYGLLCGMLPRRVAVLGAMLWALDPFVIGFSRVIHVDALSGTFMVLGVLAACRYFFFGVQHRFLVLSAVCAALAMVTKSPGLIMGPVVAGIAAYASFVNREPRIKNQQPNVTAGSRFSVLGSRFSVLGSWFSVLGSWFSVRWFLLPLLLWSAVTVAAAVLAWPALWANPRGAFNLIWIGYTAEGTQPHATGNFFLGRPDPAPGVLFYPVAILLRLTPITFLGMLALPWAVRATPFTTAQRRGLLGMAWFAILFTCAMSVFAKKFNRYIEPIFPMLDVFAAIGLLWLGGAVVAWVARRMGRKTNAQNTAGIVGASVVALAALNVAWWHPYYIAGYNQVFGGARTGAWAFAAGWGEGLNQVAAWLNDQPNSTGVLTITTQKTGLQTYLRPGVQSAWAEPGPLPPRTGYVVVYIMEAQGGPVAPPFDQFHGKIEPTKVIQIHGVDYAWIYAAPPEVERSVAASFGGAALYGINLPQERTVGGTVRYTLFWKPNIEVPANTHLFAHLIGPDGTRRAQADLPFPPQQKDAQGYSVMDLPLQVPADAPPGQYVLSIGLYTPDGGRLPVSAPEPVDAAINGPDALVLDRVELVAP